MSKFRRLKHTFLRLSAEERVTLIGGLLVLVGAFLPWYQISLKVDSRNVVENGFSGDLGVIGFVIFLITLLAVLQLTGEHLGFRLPTFGYAKERVILFLMGQSAFMLLLSVAIYTKRSLDFTEAELRFGLYLALIGGILGTLSAYAFTQKLKRKEAESFFKHPEEEESAAFEPAPEEVVTEAMADEEEKPEEEQMQITEIVEEPELAPEEPERPEITVTEVIEIEPVTETEEEIKAEEEAEEEAEKEALEEALEEVIEEELFEEPAAATTEEVVEEEEEKEVKKEKKKDSGAPSMNFYED
ncbi:MAG: hypothetical protein V1908_01115 [Candidatus Peregrinibacteria bacterium]